VRGQRDALAVNAEDRYGGSHRGDESRVVVQIGSPQDIYDRPADMHVRRIHRQPAHEFFSKFSPAWRGQTSVQLNGEAIRVPALRQGVVEGELALGVRRSM